MSGRRVVAATTENTVVARPEMIVWFDLTRKVGISMNAGYTIARPFIVMTTSSGADRRRLNADLVSIKLGFVYRLF